MSIDPAPAPPRCAEHAADAVAACARCGAYVCAGCSKEVEERRLCTACLARPEVRLRPSPRARRALWTALLGFHGLVPLLPLSLWWTRAELRDIERGHAPAPGRPFAQVARIIAWVGLGLWFAAGIWFATR
jgi:hypothetical protein